MLKRKTTQTPKPKNAIQLCYCLLIVCLISLVCYVNTLNAGFVYDDNRAILRNSDLKPETPWTNILQNDFWGTPLSHSGSHKSYRPICVLSFRLNYYYGKLNPWGYHFVNNILHAITSILFTYLCYNLLKKTSVALFGGVIFAVHPVHTEAVAGVVGRADVGAAVFFLLSLILYERSTCNIENNEGVNVLKFVASLICASASMYTKELGVTVLGVCVVLEMLLISKCNVASPKDTIHQLRSTGGLHRIAILIAYTVVMLYIRVLLMGYVTPEFSATDNPAANHSDFIVRLLTFLYLPFCNLWLLLYPWKLSYDWSGDVIPLVENILSIECFCSCMLYGVMFLIAFIYLSHCTKHFTHIHIMKNENYKQKRKDLSTQSVNIDEKMKITDFIHNYESIMIFSIAFMIITFLPASNLFFYVGFVIAERVLYIPSIGFVLLVVNGVDVLMTLYESKKHTVISMVVTMCAFFAVKTYIRNFVWESEELLYRSGISVSPAKSYGNLANILINQNKIDEAEQAYRSALRYRSNMADTHYNLGLLLQKQGRYKEAIQCYENAIKYRPRLAAAHANLGITLMDLKNYDAALKVFRNAYNISDHGLKDPAMHATSVTSIRYSLGRCHYERREYEEAIKVLLDTIKRMPDGYEAQSIYNMIGQSYEALSNFDNAEAWYIKALQFKEDHVPALLAYAKLHSKRNHLDDRKKAEDKFKKAISLDGKRVESYMLYAQFLHNQARIEDSLNVLKKVLEFEPSNAQVYVFLSDIYREQRQYEKAIENQVKAVRFSPKDVSMFSNLGALYHLAGKYDLAEQAYFRGREMQPDNPLINDNIRKLHRAMKK